MSALRANPHFAPLFERVNPLCWPILWWSLNRLLDWFETANYEEVLYATNRWGYIRIAYYGDKKPDPSAYRPYALEKPRWDDACWATNVPVMFLTPSATSILPREAGGGGSRLSLWRSRETEGACALSTFDTS